MRRTTKSQQVARVLFSEAQLSAMVGRVAREIERDYRALGEPPVLLGVLNGSVVFLSDLMRALEIPCDVDFVAVQSYRGERSTGAPRLRLSPKTPLAGRHVLVVEDILDTGVTLSYLCREYLPQFGAASVKLCALLDKPSRRMPDAVCADYAGAVIPDLFVVGYGLDYDEAYRDLPYIGVLSGTPEHKE